MISHNIGDHLRESVSAFLNCSGGLQGHRAWRHTRWCVRFSRGTLGRSTRCPLPPEWPRRRVPSCLGSHAPRPVFSFVFSRRPDPVVQQSTTQADYGRGSLWQVVRTTDRQSINVTVGERGVADASAQTSFCASFNDGARTAAPYEPPRWAPGPCCSDDNPAACPDRCDRKSPGACPKDPGCVGCASCGSPKDPDQLKLPTCMITRIFDQSGNGIFRSLSCPPPVSCPPPITVFQ